MHRIVALAALLVSPSPLTSQQHPTLFDAPVVAIDGWSRFDEMLDVDLDGDLDGVGLYLNQLSSSAQPAFVQMKLHRNDGSGHFTSSILYSWSSTPGEPTQYRSAVGDVDGDGHADVVTLRGGELWIVESRPGQPIVRTLTNINGLSLQFTTAARLLDLNGDGRAELVTADTFHGLRTLYLDPPQFPSHFSQRSIAVPTVGSTELTLLDANADGQMDAAIVDGGVVLLYALSTLGGMAPFASYVLPPGISTYGNLGHLVSGDVDNDGDADLVVFSDAGQYAWLERSGPAQFVVRPAALGGPATNLYDFDGDGDLDGCCCGGGGPMTNSPNTGLGNFEIAENRGGGVFAPAWRMQSVGPFHLAGCADLNGDGIKDLMGGRCIYFGRGKHDPVPTVLSAIPLSQPVDVDRDGDPDVIDAAAGQRTNLGDGAFVNSTIMLPPLPAGQSWQLRPGLVDVDLDGDVDIIARQVVGSTASESHLLRNAGGGYFVDAGAVTPPGTAILGTTPLLACDVDGDGDVDLVAVDGVLNSQLWLQAGGTFVPGPTWPNARVLAAADFTNDGRDDLLVATYPYAPATYYMQLSLYESQPAGGFAPRSIPDVLQSLERLGVVDYDGDGDRDLILVGYPNNQTALQVWLNNGHGQFTAGPMVAAFQPAYGASIDVEDLDGDGLWDLVAGPAGYYDVPVTSNAGIWVVRQSSPHQFVSVLYSADMGWPMDLDGDGDLDLLSKTFMRNVARAGMSAGAREQFGSSLAGTGGALPTLGATGPFRAGATVSTTLTGGCGQGLAVVLASLARTAQPTAPLSGFAWYVDAPIVLGAFVLTGSVGAPGEGRGAMPLVLPANAGGATFYQQAVVFDPAGVAPGLTHTAALRIQIGW